MIQTVKNTMASVLLAILSPALTNGQQEPLLARFYTGAEAEILGPGLISTEQAEFHPTFDASRGELYFMRRTPGIFDYTIYCSKLSEEGWSKPVVAPFSGEYRDAAPYLAPGGQKIFFDSSRPDPRVAKNSINLWHTKRTGTTWGEPELLLAPSLNDEDEPIAGRDEFGPAVDSNGRLFFYSFRGPFRGGSHYASDPPDYQNVYRLPDFPDPSARTFVAYLYISPDWKIALLEGRAQNRGDRDLYCACRDTDGRWGRAVALSALNTPSEEGQPALSPDGQYMLFTSNRPTGNSKALNDNLYIVPAEEILRFCKAESLE